MMNPLIKRFLIRTTMLFLFLGFAGYLIYSQIIPQHYQVALPITLIFFFLLTNLIHAYLLKVAEKDMSKFTTRFMGMSFIKMFVYVIFGVAFALLNRETAKIFLANFLFMYICFSVLEVYEITRVVRRKN